MKNIFFIISVFLVFITINTNAQDDIKQEVLEAVDSVNACFQRLSKHTTDEQVIRENNYIQSYLDFILNEEINQNLELNNIGKVTKLSTDDNLSIYTWNVVFNDGSHKYFGYIRLIYDNEIKLFKLIDTSSDTTSAQKFESYADWYGAIYYEIVKKQFGSKEYYLLIGWDGADLQINRKVIEILNINKRGEPEFGSYKVFIKNKEKHTRIIYEYNERATMILRYNKTHDIIVADHLKPIYARFEGVNQYYAPTLLFDAFKFEKGKWIYQHNIDPNIAIDYKKNRRIEKLKNNGISTDF